MTSLMNSLLFGLRNPARFDAFLIAAANRRGSFFLSARVANARARSGEVVFWGLVFMGFYAGWGWILTWMVRVKLFWSGVTTTAAGTGPALWQRW